MLKPLAEIAADEVHPLVNENYASLWQAYDKNQQKLWAINFYWSPTEL